MMPEIKKITNLNIEKEMRIYANQKDAKAIEMIYDISSFILSDEECVFIYDLADGVDIKHIECYLNQYWKAYWNSPNEYLFMTPFIVNDLRKEGFIKYSEGLSNKDHQKLYHHIFVLVNSCVGSDCPYAE